MKTYAVLCEKDINVQCVHVQSDSMGGARKAAKERLPDWEPTMISELDEA